MFVLRHKLLIILSLFVITLMTGCEQADNGMLAEAPQQGASSTAKLVVGSQENPHLRGTGDTRFRATWDGRTVILDIRNEQGVLPSDVAVNAKIKIRVPKDERDRFEDEADDDNSLSPGTFLAIYDAESQVYVAQLPTTITIPKNRKVKVKVVATNYKTANGKVQLSNEGPTYVGVLLRQKKNYGGGNSSLGVEALTALSVNPTAAQVVPDAPLRLNVIGTLASGSTVADPPTDISISPAGATVTVDLADGSYQFTATSQGVYSVSFSDGPVSATSTVTVTSPEPPANPILGYRTGTVDGWANNVAGFLDHVNATDNGFYDGGWNFAFAVVESSATGGGIGAPGFGQGVVIGSLNQFYLYLTDGLWATTYLRGAGGPAGALTATQGNGVSSTSSGDFGRQVLALKFNVDFSNPPTGSNLAAGYFLPAGFGKLKLRNTSSSLDGLTITQILAQANTALGGGSLPSGYSYSSLNELLISLNGAFANGNGTAWANSHLEVVPGGGGGNPPVDPPAPSITGYKTGSVDAWAYNLSSFLSHINATDNGFYDGGWNVAFATVESSATQGGIGVPGFGQGVVIGSVNQLYIYLTDGLWATTYLRGAGGPAGALTSTHGNGVSSTTSGDFGRQVLALKFNVDFSNPPTGSTVEPGYYLPSGFGSLRLKATGGSLDGSSIAEILTASNLALGSNVLPSGYTFESLNSLLTNLNTGFETGTGTGWANAHLEASVALQGYRTGTLDDWSTNVGGILSNIQATNNGFYDGGWNLAFAMVESSEAQGGIGAPGFGQGVVIGAVEHFYLYLTDGIWATTYLQGAGGAASALTATQGNGVTTTASGDFGQQILALKFNVDFSNPPAGSTVTAGYYLPAGFGEINLQGTGTSLDGSTISQVLAAANQALGGGDLPSGVSYAELSSLVTNLNGSFSGGTSSLWATAHLR